MQSEPHVYTALWNKYRPVILSLMSASEKGAQQYKLYPHEFKAASNKEKVVYTFVLEASNGKALNNIKTSPVAQDLLKVLQQSQKASQLMREAIYQVSMDRQFMLHISRKVEIPAPAPAATPVATES